MKLKCVKPVVIEGEPFADGTVVDEIKIAAGSLSSLLRLGYFVRVEDESHPTGRESAATPNRKPKSKTNKEN